MNRSKEQRQTKVNFYTNVVALLANVGVGLYYTPYLVDTLGLAAYGVLPLALIVNHYITIATSTLTHAYTRFYSVALQRAEYENASKSISTSMYVVAIICACLVPVGALVVRYADRLFTIPQELLASARMLFVFTILSLFVSLFSSLLNVTLYAVNRLDLMNWIKVSRTVLKLLVVVLFFRCAGVDISYVGLSGLIVEVLVLLASIRLFVSKKPSQVVLGLKYFDRTFLCAILGMSVWVLLQLGGDTLLYRTDALIVNRYWGVVASGVLGAITEIGNYVAVAIGVIGGLFGPLVLIAYSKGDHAEVKSLFVEQSTIVGCLTALICGIIAGAGSQVLELWLQKDLGVYHWWLFLKMIVLPFYASGGILALVYRSWNRVKFPAVGTLLLGVADIAVMVAVCEWGRPHSPLVVLAINAVFGILQCYLLNVVSVLRIYGDCRPQLLRIAGKIAATFAICFAFSRLLAAVIPLSNFPQLVLFSAVSGVVLLGVVCLAVLDKAETRKFVSLIK